MEEGAVVDKSVRAVKRNTRGVDGKQNGGEKKEEKKKTGKKSKSAANEPNQQRWQRRGRGPGEGWSGTGVGMRVAECGAAGLVAV